MRQIFYCKTISWEFKFISNVVDSFVLSFNDGYFTGNKTLFKNIIFCSEEVSIKTRRYSID